MNDINEWLSRDNKEQNERYERSKKNVLTPQSVNSDTQTAVFKSEHGIYNTTLYSCNCFDFNKRNLPCKHIFRLALELNMIDGEYKSFIHGGYSWKEAVELLEKFPEEVQLEFFKHYDVKNTSPKKKKKTPEMQILIDNGYLIEYPEKETKCFKTVAVIQDFYKETKYFKQYFHRKFYGGDIYYDEELNEHHSPLPDDLVTKFLHEHGFRIGE